MKLLGKLASPLFFAFLLVLVDLPFCSPLVRTNSLTEEVGKGTAWPGSRRMYEGDDVDRNDDQNDDDEVDDDDGEC